MRLYQTDITPSDDPFHVTGLTDNRIVEKLVEMSRDKHVIVELGSWKGRTAIAMAWESPDDALVYAVDTWIGNGDKETIEAANHSLTVYREFLANIGQFARIRNKIVPLTLPTMIAANLFQDQSIDMLYIDAGHTYWDVMGDLSCWWDKVTPSGVICGDDARSFAVHKAVDDFSVLKNFTYTLSVDDKFWIVDR